SQLACFRLKELKDVLGHLGLSKSGKKQVLVDRIEALLSSPSVPFNGRVPTITPTQVAEFIQDTYRSLRSTGQQADTPVASPVQPQRRREERVDRDVGEGAERGDGGAETAGRAETGARVEVVGGGGRASKRAAAGRGDVYGQQQQQVEVIRCVCLRNFDNGKTMIQCEGQGCGVWQHVKCVILPENPPLTVDTSAAPQPDLPLPEHHYCELCRMARGDPFSVPVANPMPPTALIRLPGDNNQLLQCLEHTFTLNPHPRCIHTVTTLSYPLLASPSRSAHPFLPLGSLLQQPGAAAARAHLHSHGHSTLPSLPPFPTYSPQQPGAAATRAHLHSHAVRPFSPQTPAPLPAGGLDQLKPHVGRSVRFINRPGQQLLGSNGSQCAGHQPPRAAAAGIKRRDFVRVTNRPGQQLLGANGRDDGPSIAEVCHPGDNHIAKACHAGDNHMALAAINRQHTPSLPCFHPPLPPPVPLQIAEACHAGDNHIALAAIDKRPFCIGVRIIRKRSFDEVMAMIPPLDVGESLESAFARVKRCVGGGGGGGGGKGGSGGGGGAAGGGGGGGPKAAASSDSSGSSSDLIVMQDHVTLNLRCPVSVLAW
ncbi:unnamed protein product, partial [Closterium sp. Naga37s-1]